MYGLDVKPIPEIVISEVNIIMTTRKEITYSKAIEMVLRDNGGYAPLKLIYKNLDNYRPRTGKDPDATIRERLQREDRFTCIGYGVYALTKQLAKVPRPKKASTSMGQKHADIQGMLIEIGNMQSFDTYTPDKKHFFGNKQLGKIITMETIPVFTTKETIINKSKYIDVIWFNDREFPQVAFEVEHTSDFNDSLLRLFELQDFNTQFILVAPNGRKTKYNKEVGRSIFKDIKNRCHFMDYSEIEDHYNNRKPINISIL